MDEEDNDFLGSGTARSRLSSLFQNDHSSGDINQALTFTAPKQPKKKDDSVGAIPALKLLHATVVHCFKLKDGNYSSEGKLGCAILGHHESSSYKLLLYKGKQIKVTIATITANFAFHVQPNNYANFYDEKKENWSINFDSETALFDFTKQVALAKANCQGKDQKILIMQDILCGDGDSLDNGDIAELKYTGWLLSNFSFGQVFDSNMNSDSTYKVCLGKSKIIKGWSEGLIGMQKGGKRLLIIPPDLAYGSEGMGNVIPPNSTLIFEIHAVKIKHPREFSHSPSPNKTSETAVEKKPEVPPRQSFSHDDNIRSRGASISEQLTQSPKKDKAQLISRMAKMGTAMLPFQGAIPAQVSSDSESETEAPQTSSPAPQAVSRNSSPKSFTKPRSRHSSASSAIHQAVQPQPIPAAMPFPISQQPNQVPLYSQSAMSVQPFTCAAAPFSPYQPHLAGQFPMPQSPFGIQNVATPIASSVADSHLPLLITEARNQNTEVRMNLLKMSDKIDNVLQKVDDLRSQGRVVSANTPFMESAILLQNIERIVQENSHLKEEIESKNLKIQSLNEKIYDLFQRNQRFFEESSSMLEQKSDSLQAASAQSHEQISNLEQEKVKLQLELSSASAKLNTLEADLMRYQKLEGELNQKLLDNEKVAKQQDNLLNEDQLLLSSLKETLQNVEQEKKKLMEKIKSLEEDQSKTAENFSDAEIYKNEIAKYKEKIEQMNIATNAYQEKTRVMKEKYESQILELMNEVKHLQSTKSVSISPEFSVEIKKVMNILYKLLQGKFESESSYLGSKVLQTILQAIKSLTFQILDRKNQPSDEQSADSSKKKTISEAQQGSPNPLEAMPAELNHQNRSVEEASHSFDADDGNKNDKEETVTVSQQDAKNLQTDTETAFSQQNGLEESKLSDTTSDELLISNVENSQKSVENELLKTSGTDKTAVQDSSVNTPGKKCAENMSNTEADIKRESPEMWRQPPPLDDDEDDDDDDWLK